MLGATEEIGPERQFLAFLAEGRFMLQRSKAAGACFFYPRVAAPGTGEGDLEWVEVSGRGRVYSTTVIRARPPAPSYNVALIDLEEGPRMMSRVEGIPPEAVAIGMAVTAAIVPGEPHPCVVFRPAG
jgi:uncharacterized OB-fold protein